MTAKQRPSRRSFIGGAAAAAAAGLSAPHVSRAQGKPSRLIHSTYGGDYGAWVKEAYELPFTEKTGIALDHDIGENPARFAKLQNFRSRPRFHIITLQDRYLFQAAHDGLLEQIDYANVPNAATVVDRFKSPTSVSYSYSAIGLVYNTDHVKTPPKNWEDVLNDAYKGRIFVDDFNHFGLHVVLAIALARGGGYQNIQPGFDFIKELKEKLNPRFISTSQEGMKLLDSGEVHVAMWQSSRAFTLKSRGKPVDFAIPETGDVAVSYGSAIVKGADAKAWGEAYLNCVADPVLQAKFSGSKVVGISYPTNTRTEMPADIAPMLKRPEKDNQFAIDYAEVLPRLADWTKIWNQTVAG